MAAPKNKKVNLLIREGFEYTTLGKTLSWLLSAGRTIVIFTELVVIIAFLSRFWLDRSLTDLIEQNNTKKTQIQAAQAFETEFRSAQTRLATYQKLDTTRISASKLVKNVSSLLPSDVALTELTMSKGRLNVHGTSLSEGGLAGFIKAVEDSGKYKNVKLTDIALQTGGQRVISFVIDGDLIPEKTQGGTSGTN
jgi:Tfp pilus assembly protein PilN